MEGKWLRSGIAGIAVLLSLTTGAMAIVKAIAREDMEEPRIVNTQVELLSPTPLPTQVPSPSSLPVATPAVNDQPRETKLELIKDIKHDNQKTEDFEDD
ncbi:MAG: hypothetical protein WCG44_02475 [bacterium]